MAVCYYRVARAALVALGFLCMLAGVGGSAFGGLMVPELDPGSMANALLVLSGGLLIITGRRRRKSI